MPTASTSSGRAGASVAGPARARRRRRSGTAPAGAAPGPRRPPSPGRRLCRSAAAAKPSHQACPRDAGLQLGVVGEQAQRLRVAGEQVGDVPGQAQHPGQAAARPGPRRAAAAGTTGCCPSLSETVPVVQQAAVRLGRVGELLQQHRQQGALDRRGPGHARRSAPARCRSAPAGSAKPRISRRAARPTRGSAAAPRRAPGRPPPAAAGRAASRAAGAPRAAWATQSDAERLDGVAAGLAV